MPNSLKLTTIKNKPQKKETVPLIFLAKKAMVSWNPTRMNMPMTKSNY
jgi:hypothetical protein